MGPRLPSGRVAQAEPRFQLGQPRAGALNLDVGPLEALEHLAEASLLGRGAADGARLERLRRRVAGGRRLGVGLQAVGRLLEPRDDRAQLLRGGRHVRIVTTTADGSVTLRA